MTAYPSHSGARIANRIERRRLVARLHPVVDQNRNQSAPGEVGRLIIELIGRTDTHPPPKKNTIAG